MNLSQSDKPALPDGPDAPYDLQTSAESFRHLQDWVAEYPDIFSLTPEKRRNPAVFVNQADYIKQILVSHHEAYQKGVGFERVKMLLGNGIIVSDGAFWRKQRRMIQPAFGKDMIAGLVGQVKQANLNLRERWRQLASEQAELNITDATNELALEIILRALFSTDLDEIYQQAGGNPFAILTDNSTRDLQLAVKFRALTQIVAEVIALRRASQAQRQDFLSIMLAAHDRDTGEPMSDKELIDEVMTLIVAGSETSATTLNFAWYRLSQHPDVESRLQQEVDQASYPEIPDYAHIGELGYVRQVTEEVLRLYPPVWLFTRKAIAQDRLGDYDIMPGTDIFIAPYFIHRHAQYWPEPERFDPDRFLPEAIKQRHKFCFIPFSAGPRRCIGDFFAIVEAQIHFGLLAREFTLEYVEDHPLELAPEVNLRSKHPITMRVHMRNQKST